MMEKPGRSPGHDARVADPAEPTAEPDIDLDALLTALNDDPTRQDILARLHGHERALRYRGAHGELAELYEAWYGVESDPERRTELLRQRADLLETRLGELDRAFTLRLADYRMSRNRVVWPHLQRLARATGQWSELLQQLADTVPELVEDERVDALLHIARLHDEELGSTADALQYLDIALEIEPGHPAAEKHRLTLLRQSEQWDPLARFLAERAEREASLVARSEILVELAEVCENRLDDPRQALATYRRAVACDPGFSEARLAYESLLRRRRAHAELAQSLEERLGATEGAERSGVLRELASLFRDRLGEPWRAIRYYEELRSEAPADFEVLRALAELYRAQNSLREYLDVLTAQLGVTESNRERARLSRAMAWCWQELGSDAKAEECLEWALSYGGLNAETFAQLEAMYLAAERWHAAIDLITRRAQAIDEMGESGEGRDDGESGDSESAERPALDIEIAEIFERHLGDSMSAIEYYDRAVSAEGCSDEVRDRALAGMTRCHEQRGDFADLVDVLTRRAEHAERAARVELLCRAAEVARKQLRDRPRAEALLDNALASDPTCVPAMRALAGVYLREGKPHKALPRIEDALALRDDGAERCAILIEAGEVHEALGKRVHAARCYRAVLDSDPDNRDAMARLGEICWVTGQHREAMELFRKLVRDDAPPDEQFHHVLRLGQSAAACGDAEQAQVALERAVRMAPDDFQVQLTYGEFLHDQGDWQRARHALRAALDVLARKRARRDDLVIADLDFKVASCCKELGLLEEARSHVEAARRAVPHHRPSLWLFLDPINLDALDIREVFEQLDELFEIAPDDEKARVLCKKGEVHLRHLDDPDTAMEHFQQALIHQPGDHLILHQCIDALVAQKDWDRTMAVLDELIATESSPAVRAKYRYTQAMIHLEERGDTSTARRLLWTALEDDSDTPPSTTEAGKTLEELLEREGAWQPLAEYYVLALKKLGPAPERHSDPEDSLELLRSDLAGQALDDGYNAERLRMWSTLAEICENKVGDVENALWAYEVVATLRTDPDLALHARMAALYQKAGPDKRVKAIEQVQLLLRHDKGRVDHYETLKNLYREGGAKRESRHCATARRWIYALSQSAGAAISVADDPDGRDEGARIDLSGRILDHEAWAAIRHPDEDSLLSRLFALVGPLFTSMNAVQPSRLGVRDSMEISRTDARRFAVLLRQVAGVFNAPLPRAYACPELTTPGRVAMLSTSDGPIPALLLGRRVIDNQDEAEIVFQLARVFTALQPALVIQHVFGHPAELATIIDAVIELAGSAERGDAGRSPGDRSARELESRTTERFHTVAREGDGALVDFEDDEDDDEDDFEDDFESVPTDNFAAYRPGKATRRQPSGRDGTSRPATARELADRAATAGGPSSRASTAGLSRSGASHTRTWIEKTLSPIALDRLVTVGRILGSRATSSRDAATRWLTWADHTASRAGLVLADDLHVALRGLMADPATNPAVDQAARLRELAWSSVTPEIMAVRRRFDKMRPGAGEPSGLETVRMPEPPGKPPKRRR